MVESKWVDTAYRTTLKVLHFELVIDMVDADEDEPDKGFLFVLYIDSLEGGVQHIEVELKAQTWVEAKAEALTFAAGWFQTHVVEILQHQVRPKPLRVPSI